ncbi:hypothetical protein L7F22_021457 [Adiantum nelumboides]|nr:hypothetical protein [Adiantum nelumboides]
MEGYPTQQHPESSSQDMHALGQQHGSSMFSRLKETLSIATRSEHATNEINKGGGEVDSLFTSQIDLVLSESAHVSTPTTTSIGSLKLSPSETLLPDGRSLAEVQEVERYILAARERKIKSLRKAEQRFVSVLDFWLETAELVSFMVQDSWLETAELLISGLASSVLVSAVTGQFQFSGYWLSTDSGSGLSLVHWLVSGQGLISVTGSGPWLVSSGQCRADANQDSISSLGMMEDLPVANSQAALIQNARLVARLVRTTTIATSSRATRSTKTKSSSYEEKTETDEDEDTQRDSQEKVPLEFEKDDEEDSSTPLERKGREKIRGSTVPRIETQICLCRSTNAEAQKKVKERKKKLVDARAAKKAASIAVPPTMEQARQAQLEKAKELQAKRKWIEEEQRAKEVDLTFQSPQEPKEKETVDITGHLKHLKLIQREKQMEEQRAVALAQEKIKENLKRTAEEAVLEPREEEPKKQ